jgi:demethylmenaquinone methyltransferase/2-methoxy-6-polyprenyl-1,4-benzoquinol methylase
MHDKHRTIVKVEEEIFGASPHGVYFPAFQSRGETLRKRESQIPPPLFDLADGPAYQKRLQASSDRFNLWQFRHPSPPRRPCLHSQKGRQTLCSRSQELGMSSASFSKQEQSEIDFGFSKVPLPEKQGLVDDVFHSVAAKYDVMNDVMSLGQHRIWKDVLVQELHPSGHWRHLDMAGGTGDVAFKIVKAAGLDSRVIVSDINQSMLDVGEERAATQNMLGQVSFRQANAESLPFEDNSFDGYTIAFGIRNVPRRELALREAFRVLKRGGRFMCLEFSHVDVPVLESIYKAYSFSLIPSLGGMIAGDASSYRYLVESIAQFPSAETFRQLIGDAGFARTSYTKLSGGIVAIHSGWKL